MSSTSSSSSSTSSSQPPPWPSSAHFQTSSASSSSDSSAPSSPLSPVTQLVSPPASSNRKRSSGFQVLSRPAPKSHQASVSAPCSFPLSNGDSVSFYFLAALIHARLAAACLDPTLPFADHNSRNDSLAQVPSSGHNTSLGLDFSAPSDAPGMTAALPPVTNVLVTQDGSVSRITITSLASLASLTFEHTSYIFWTIAVIHWPNVTSLDPQMHSLFAKRS